MHTIIIYRVQYSVIFLAYIDFNSEISSSNLLPKATLHYLLFHINIITHHTVHSIELVDFNLDLSG